MYYRRLVLSWQHLLQSLNCNINSTNFYAHIIQKVWTTTLAVWKICNSHLHPSDPTHSNQSQLHITVQQLFHEANNDILLRPLIANITIEAIMQLPTKQLQWWTINSHNHIQAHRKAAQKQATMNNHDICNFLGPWSNTPKPQTNSKNLLRPP